MDTCFIIDQINENLFNESNLIERLQEIKQSNKHLDANYGKSEIESAMNAFELIKKKLSSQIKMSSLYQDILKEIEKFINYHTKFIEMYKIVFKNVTYVFI